MWYPDPALEPPTHQLSNLVIHWRAIEVLERLDEIDQVVKTLQRDSRKIPIHKRKASSAFAGEAQ